MQTETLNARLKSKVTTTPDLSSEKFYVAAGEEFDGCAYELTFNVFTTRRDDLKIERRAEKLKAGEYLEVYHEIKA